MSASLVGSEMCIRDSAPPPHGGRGRCAKHEDSESSGERPRRSRQWTCTCLLYTSDAADDM
eukprot:3478459-Alexandrium_andersonii.AAC.1